MHMRLDDLPTRMLDISQLLGKIVRGKKVYSFLAEFMRD
jgi:hypothetical protein